MDLRKGDVVRCIDGRAKYYPAIVTADPANGRVKVSKWDLSREEFKAEKTIPLREVVRKISGPGALAVKRGIRQGR